MPQNKSIFPKSDYKNPSFSDGDGLKSYGQLCLLVSAGHPNFRQYTFVMASLWMAMLWSMFPAPRWAQGQDATSPDWSAQLQDLPTVKPLETGDWLVEPAARTAGVFRGESNHELVLDNGWIRRRFLLSPNLGCIGLEHGAQAVSLLRAVRPEARLTIDNQTWNIGGLSGQATENFLRKSELGNLRHDPQSFQFASFSVTPIQSRFAWRARPEWLSRETAWPPQGLQVSFEFAPPASAPPSLQPVRVKVHYELYDGLPLMCKWITVVNEGANKIRIDSFVSEILAAVEASSQVEDLAEPFMPNLHVETDFTSCSMEGSSAQRDAVHWIADPAYATQVNYRRETRCLLECRPPLGPKVELMAGETFASFRTWMLALADRDETRRTLALCRMYATIAPWSLENPLIFHVRSAEPAAVRTAIDQAAAVGFELVIMTFGSGFNMENVSPKYLQEIKQLVDYAHQRGVALGGYSLLASRSIDEKNDVINPETGKPGGFARFGNSPCLESEWGQTYFQRLHEFLETTGCDVLEHDGSYPGDACGSTEHPGHHDLEDSRWRQWQRITTFYHWCRARGIYLNVPDWYFLQGSNKVAMGYRETNWSLPRDQQELIERQNIYDGTRFKNPTMGWMFVPLTEYHGGGAAATIEPLHEHLDHYQRRLQNLWGAGVQACFRGPRLFDTSETKEMLLRWVTFYKKHRAILDSPLIGLRRADGQDWDGWLHVNPQLKTSALAAIYNPLPYEIEREIRLPLYYAGQSRDAVRWFLDDQPQPSVALNAKLELVVTLRLPAQSMRWITVEKEIK